MFNKWIVNVLKEVERKALQAHYQPNIAAVERVYGKETAQNVVQLFKQTAITSK